MTLKEPALAGGSIYAVYSGAINNFSSPQAIIDTMVSFPKVGLIMAGSAVAGTFVLDEFVDEN